MKNLTARVPTLIYLQYSNFCLSRQWTSLYFDRLYI